MDLRPDVKSLGILDLIKDVKMKTYLLPPFQRRFVWDADDVKEFLDSILKGYPVGSIILWKPSRKIVKEDIFSKPIIGDKKNENRDFYYIIDGQQRLTALLLLFNDWQIKREGEIIPEERTPISIVITRNGYRLYKSERRGINLSKIVKAYIESDTKLQAEIDRYIGDFRKSLDEIVDRLRNYKMPIYTIETTDEDDSVFEIMAESFVRVNRSGVRIGNVELMLSFLAGKVSSKLKMEISNFYNQVEKEFKINFHPLIRYMLSNFDLKQTSISKVTQFVSSIKKIREKEKEADEILEKSKKVFTTVLKFLRRYLLIKDFSILPSQIPLVTLAKYFYVKNIQEKEEIEIKIAEEEARKIMNWFILANFFGHYSSRTDTKLDRDLSLVTESRKFPYEQLVENIGKEKIKKIDIKKGLERNVLRATGKAYLFLLYIILAKADADDWTNVKITEKEFKDLSKHHIFPKEYLKANLDVDDPDTLEIKINNLGNITFISKSKNEEIQDQVPEEYLKELPESTLEKHFIPKDKNLWKLEQYENFLSYRVDQIYLKAKEAFPEIFE